IAATWPNSQALLRARAQPRSSWSPPLCEKRLLLEKRERRTQLGISRDTRVRVARPLRHTDALRLEIDRHLRIDPNTVGRLTLRRFEDSDGVFERVAVREVGDLLNVPLAGRAHADQLRVQMIAQRACQELRAGSSAAIDEYSDRHAAHHRIGRGHDLLF